MTNNEVGTYPDERQGNIDKELNQPLTLKVLCRVSSCGLGRHNTGAESTDNLPLKHVADLIQNLLSHRDAVQAWVFCCLTGLLVGVAGMMQLVFCSASGQEAPGSGPRVGSPTWLHSRLHLPLPGLLRLSRIPSIATTSESCGRAGPKAPHQTTNSPTPVLKRRSSRAWPIGTYSQVPAGLQLDHAHHARWETEPTSL